MRLRPLLLLLALVAGLGCGPAGAFERVVFRANDVVLAALLYRPAGPGPHPAVVALHGCTGLFDRDGNPSRRHEDWGARLAAAGFLVLFPDSFGPRGLGPQCRVAERAAPPRLRAEDALAARAYLQARGDVRAEAVSLLGWSNGGTTVLRAVEPRRAPADGGPDFHAAVAFYPGCRIMAERRVWRTRMPLLLLLGGADDWTPAAPCEALARLAQARGEPVEAVTYPGALHGFDHPDQPVTRRRGLAFTGSGSGEAMTGTDPEGRADALRRVPEFLRR